MPSPRLSAALEGNLLAEPAEGRLLVVGISRRDDFSALAGDVMDVHAIQPLQPDHDRLAADSVRVAPDFSALQSGFDMALIALPRSKALARDWIAHSAALLRPGGVLVVDGSKTDGIDSLYRAARPLLDGADSLTKAHGRLFWGRPVTGSFDAWRATATEPDGFLTAPGVFSAEHVDPGSAALAAALPATLPPQMADLGAGWGYLAAQALARRGPASLHLVEADHAALSAARVNVTDPRARFHWADATAWEPPAPLDAVLMNPPFHTGRAANPDLGRRFIGHAAEILAAQGQLWLVANRHLPYESDLTRHFAQWREIGGTAAFKLIHAAGPRRSRRGHRK